MSKIFQHAAARAVLVAAAVAVLPGHARAQGFPDEAVHAQRLVTLVRQGMSGKTAQAAAGLDMLVAQDELCRPAADARCQRPLILALGASGEMHAHLGQIDLALDRLARALDVYQADVPGLGVKTYPTLFNTMAALCAIHHRETRMLPYLRAALRDPGTDRMRDRWFRQGAWQRLGQLAVATGDVATAEAALSRAVDERIALIGVDYPGTNVVGNWRASDGDLTMFRNQQQRKFESDAYLALGNSLVLGDGQEAPPPVPDVSWAGTGVNTAIAMLVDLYRDQHRVDDLVALYDGRFAEYARRERARALPGGYADLEAEYARFAAAFGAARRWPLARAALAQALRLNAGRVSAESAAVPADQLVAAFATRRALTDLQLSLHLASGADPGDWPELAGNILQNKGAVAVMQARRAAVLRHTPYAEERWQGKFLDLFEPLDSLDDFKYAMATSRQLQARLAARIAPLEFEDGRAFATRMRSVLGKERFLSVSLVEPYDVDRRRRGARRYLGMLLDGSTLRLADLGPARDIDAQLLALWTLLARPPASDGAAADAMRAARAAYRAVLAPLLGPDAPAGDYVADLDGKLAGLPLDAFAGADERYLIDHGNWRYVSSARALLAPAGPARPGPALVVAGVDYDAPLSDDYYPQDDKPIVAGSRRARMQGMRLSPLPQAQDEGQIVLDALRRGGVPATLLAGAAASAEALEAVHGPRILHVATHGLYLRFPVAEERTGPFGGTVVIEHSAAYRNGALALAAANATLATGKGGGIMYASQLQHLDLDGTELVVLSACQSGTGVAGAGEAADSLRQAVEIAGAQSSISALWEVPDGGTRDLMAALYDGLGAGRRRDDALRAAKLGVKKRLPHPFYWAPFVLGGARSGE